MQIFDFFEISEKLYFFQKRVFFLDLALILAEAVRRETRNQLRPA